MNAIELSHIEKSFGGFAIQDLNLTVPCGRKVYHHPLGPGGPGA